MSKPAIADVSTGAGIHDDADLPGSVAALTIIAHPLAHRAGERCTLDLLASGHEVAISRNAPDFLRPGSALGSPLGDPCVSRRPIRFASSADGGLRMIVEPGGTAVVVAGVPREGSVELTAAQLAAGVALELADRVVVLLHRFDREPPVAPDARDGLGMLGDSAGMRRVLAAIERIVDLPVSVLIRGETGTGKELVARAIHERGPRRAGPFVSVNLGAIPRELAAAELFGSTRGAFTGATREREGLFRAAHGGTLFLDEVGEAPPEVQVMLLRVLETGELYPVGADKPVAVRLRLIAATDANLEQQIRDGRFKAPLLHRLAGYEVRLPPLRDRREDIGALFYHFAHQELAAIGELDRLAPSDPYAKPWLPASLAAQLLRYPWPGNIRQLRNLTRQLVIGNRGLAQLRLDPQLADELAAAALPAPPVMIAPEPPGPDRAARRKPSDVTEPELVEALRACAWDLQAAADRLRVPRASVYDLLDRYPKIRTAGRLAAEEIARCHGDCGGDLDAMAVRLEVSRRALQRRVKELGLAAALPGARAARPHDKH